MTLISITFTKWWRCSDIKMRQPQESEILQTDGSMRWKIFFVVQRNHAQVGATMCVYMHGKNI
jgi:hypothetical protein